MCNQLSKLYEGGSRYDRILHVCGSMTQASTFWAMAFQSRSYELVSPKAHFKQVTTNVTYLFPLAVQAPFAAA